MSESKGEAIWIYQLTQPIHSFLAGLAMLASTNPPPSLRLLGRQEYSPCKLGPEAFVFLFRFRSVGVLGVVTGFSGLGSTPVPALEWLEPPPVLESWLSNAIGL